MLTDVLETLKLTTNVDDVVVVTREPNAEVLARTYGAQVIPDDLAGGHSEAASLGIDWALAEGAFHVLVLAGDVPTRERRRDRRAAARAVRRPRGRRRPRPARHRHERAAADAARRDRAGVRRRAAARGTRAWPQDAGATVRVEEIASFMLDVDTPEDLDALAEALADSPRRTAVYTRDALSRVQRG